MSESEGFDEGDEVEVLERLTRSYREDLSEWANMGERLVLLRLRLEERTRSRGMTRSLNRRLFFLSLIVRSGST